MIRNILWPVTFMSCAVISITANAAIAPGGAAEIVSVQGVGEQRAGPSSQWLPAKSSQSVGGGTFVRTGDASKMALLFADDTQIRLNQNSLLQVKSVTKEAGSNTTLSLMAGRAWTQTKRPPGNGLNFETPAATAAIRGTDWEIEVDSQGKTLITVFSGTIDVANELGSVKVGRGESAVAEVGKAPVKLLLLHPQDRIQWVNSITVDPFRYFAANQVPSDLKVATDALMAGQLPVAEKDLEASIATHRTVLPETYHLLADIHLAYGEFERARATLEKGIAAFPGNKNILAHLARTQLLMDRLDDSRETLSRAGPLDDPAILLVQGDLARRQGDSARATRAFEQATQLAPNEDRAWFGLGSVLTEQEDTLPARRNLNRAIELRPAEPGYRGELGVLETYANRFEQAGDAFQQALAQNPGDYVALTGQGLLHLKQGNVDAALDAFLRAGVMEPRYARAKTYMAVAYYQQGRRQDAISLLRQSADLDDKDPVPYIFLSQIYTDLFQPGDAVEASRAAVERLPYLKSMNQLANDQKGSANLGASLAFFGLEDWALELAQQSYYPYWGSSHLFLADRYRGEFNKNSELFQGFLTDPLAFGADPRYSSLLRRPGGHGTVEVTSDKEFYRLIDPSITLNGMNNAYVPLAYFVKFDQPAGQLPIDTPSASSPAGAARSIQSDLQGTGLSSLGFGIQPNDRLGIFLYANDFKVGVRGDSPSDPYLLGIDKTKVDRDVWQGVLGFSYRWTPMSQSWLKLGRNTNTTTMEGLPVSFSTGGLLAELASDYRLKKTFDDIQFRHTVDYSTKTRFSLGLEQVEESLESSVAGIGFASVDVGGNKTPIDIMAFTGNNDIRRKFFAVSLSGQHQLSHDLRIDGTVVSNSMTQEVAGRTAVALIFNGVTTITPVQSNERTHIVAPRFGVVYQPTTSLVVRAAYQDWVRPLSVSTLNNVDTAGIPIDDRLVEAGGRSKRSVIQMGMALDERTFLSARADHQDIENPGTIGVDLRTPSLPFLEDLRSAQLANVSSMDVVEPISDFQSGRLSRLVAGINRILTPNLSGYLNYTYLKSDSEYADANAPGGRVQDKRIPFQAQQTAVIGATWASAQRFYLSGRAVYRSQRFEDKENLISLPARWSADLVALWETADKSLILGAGALNVGGSKSDRETTRYVFDIRYRF